MKPSQEKVWLKKYPRGVENLPLPKMSIYNYLKACAPKDTTRVALNYYGKKYSYKKLIENIDHTAKCYGALGIKPSEKVVFVTVAFPETVFSFYALNKLGAIPVFVEPRMGVSRIEEFIKMVNAKTIVIVDKVYEKIKPILDKFDFDNVIVQNAFDSLPVVKKSYAMLLKKSPKIKFNEKIISYHNFITRKNLVDIDECDYFNESVAVVTQTGGTTGVPKGVELTNDGLNIIGLNFRNSGITTKRGDKFLDIMPIFTTYGIVCGIHAILCMEVEIVLTPNFKPEDFSYLVKKHMPYSLIAVPAFYESLLSERTIKKYLKNLSFAFCGGDIMSINLERELNNYFSSHGAEFPISQGYGLSETCSVATYGANHNYKEGSVGIPLFSLTVGIFKPDTFEELDYNVVGEICISGPTVMKGYYNNKKETDNVLKVHNDGKLWLHTGDLGYIDNDGFLFFNGRIKYVIPRFDGHKNYPTQIESVVSKIDGVTNCVVIGIKDREHLQGKYPLVVVETKKGCDKTALRKEILSTCKQVLEERGQPCDAIVVEKIPLTLVGKNDVVSLENKYFDFDYIKSIKELYK